MWIMEIPRNIRQIGDIENSFHLYIEDYVATFIEKVRRKGGTSVGVLLGRLEKGDPPSLFVRGAVLMEGAEEEEGELRLTAQAWTRVYGEIGAYFKDVEVCGWFLCGSGELTDLYSLQKLHSENFKGEDQILLLWDGEKEDEAVYSFDPQGPHRLRGYYIYYERNEQMQEYMISREPARKTEFALAPSLRGTSDEAARQFRAVMEAKKEKTEPKKGVSRALRTIRIAALLCGVGFGLAAWYRYDQMQAVRDVIAVIAGGGEDEPGTEAEETEEESGQAVIQEVPGEVYPTESEETSSGAETEETAESSTRAAESSGSTEGESREPDTAARETEVQAEPSYREYQVKSGDTLNSICREFYGEHGSALKQEICELNGMDNADMIYEGQILRLPE